MSKCRVGSLRAALSLVLLAGAGSVLAADNVATLIGGDLVSGDQATVALDSTITNAFSYSSAAHAGPAVTAYLNAHVFCAETPTVLSQVVLQPRYQLPALVGNDVWKFPDAYVHDLTYQGSGIQNAGAPALVINQGAAAFSKQMRCLSAQPGDGLGLPNVSQGLFDSGFGGNTAPFEPSGLHQNVTVSAQVFGGFSGLSVSVVKVDTQFDATQPTAVTWTLVDAFNSQALSPTGDDMATWCRLRANWNESTDAPTAALCDEPNVIFAGESKHVDAFVRQAVFFAQDTSPGPYYVLVSRVVNGTATSGTPAQGFAVLRTGGGMVGVAEEAQDSFTDDSVWYNY